MKKHAIIPIFIAHEGCPHDCIFCNQNKITATEEPMSWQKGEEIIISHLKTLKNRELETIEVAFFGGSFTAIPIEKQTEYLQMVSKYKASGEIDKIHLSTRPDAIDDEILTNLKNFGVDVIELGVQSFDQEVLKASNRGHNVECVYESCDLIRKYGFELGIQLMIGLPSDTREKSIFSAKKTAEIKPDIARLYPTVIIEDTGLMDLYKKGEYIGLDHDDAVETTKEMYKILTEVGINIIRVGLKSSDIMNSSQSVTGNTFHPAFRQVVESRIARDIMEEKLNDLLENKDEVCFVDEKKLKITFFSNGDSFSNMIGHSKSNKLYFENQYRQCSFKYAVDNNLEEYEYNAKLVT